MLLLIAAVAWLGVRGLKAKSELEAAIPLAEQVKASLLDNDAEKAGSQLADLQQHTSAAVELTSDPVWRLAELVPFLGSNLSAVRESADIVARIADDGLPPVVTVLGTIDVSSFKPINGQVDLQPLLDATADVGAADDVISSALAQAVSIDTQFTLPPVTEAVDKLESVLNDANDVIGSVRTAVDLMPGMLGVNGPRNYLLMFQNNAETRALGGNSAALALINVDNGRLDLAQQAASGDFVNPTSRANVDWDIVSLFESNYSPGAVSNNIQNVTMIPDFDMTSLMAKSIWESSFPTSIDAVVSLDPIALSYIIGATGDITLPTGDVLTADNTVPLLLSEVYNRYPDGGADSDLFFASAAQAVFDRLKSGEVDATLLLEALAQSASEGRLMMWSNVPDEQDVILTTNFSGVLPATNRPNTVVGVYFNDVSVSKLDYYLDSAVDVSAPVCSPDGFDVTSTVTLTSRVPLDAEYVLPPYVYGNSPSGLMSIDVVAVGPVGATFTTYGDPSSIELLSTGPFEGREVVRLRITVPAMQTSSLSVTMHAPAGSYGPLEVKTTPMVNPTVVTTETC